MSNLPYLDPNAPFTPDSVRVLDTLITSMNGNNPHERDYAVRLLNEIKEKGNLWIHVDTIIGNATNQDTKFFALSLLDHVIVTAWNAVPEDQRSGIKNFIVKQVIDNTNSGASHFLNKLNLVLVQIVKREWTTTWRDFIPEICSASKSSQPLCENTMNVLKLLSEEIFDNTRTPLNSQKRNELKQTMNNEFSKIYELCDWILKTAALHPGAVQNSLIRSCLSTLAAFLDWIPAYHIFNGELVSFLIQNYLDHQLFRTLTLECLTEVAGVTMELNPSDPSFSLYQNSVINLLTLSMNKLSQTFPPKTTSFARIYMETDSNSQYSIKNYCQRLALFILALVQNHLILAENVALQSQGSEVESLIILSVDAMLAFMVSLSEFPDDEVFKICCEF